MINITLKARHFRFIAYLLKETLATHVFRVLNEIKSKVPNEALDTDDIEVQAKVSELTFLYPILTNLSEGLAADINKEMDLMLRPQIEAGVLSENPEWIEVATFITTEKTRKADALQSYINDGKSFLNDNEV